MINLFLSFIHKMTFSKAIAVIAIFAITFMSLMLKIEKDARIKAEKAERVAQIDVLNTIALLDSTVRITGDSIAALGDTVVLYKRLVIQEKQKNSILDNKLGQFAVANYKLMLKIDTLNARVLSDAVVDVGDSLTANFIHDEPPYHVTAKVALPKAPGKGTLDIRINQDPLPLTVHVACGKEQRNNVRSAILNVMSPEYVTVQLDSLTQAVEVCSPAPTIKGRSFFGKVWNTAKIVGVAAVAFVIGRGSM